jgi:UDP-2,4-diacetamido-2,4,6-trideoxy-beta-L-altropyranose hydrolase
MNIVIRTDASFQIGTGHVIRCLTLAEELRKRNVNVKFVCRAHSGHLGNMISSKGFAVTLLPVPTQAIETVPEKDDYAAWLGVSKKEDAWQTISALDSQPVDWLVVDHYGLDVQWEKMLRPHVTHIMAIDGIANRNHDCDMLLDPNFTLSGKARWKNRVPEKCRLLVGPEYALLKPIFSEIRALNRCRKGEIRRILIAFGGVDPMNVTSLALEAVAGLQYPDLGIDVVVGANNPHHKEIVEKYGRNQHVQIHHQTSEMAQLMNKADISIGAGGTMMWERCFLGLPALVIVLAENQVPSAEAVNAYGAIVNLGYYEKVSEADIQHHLLILMDNPEKVKLMSQQGLNLFDENCKTGTQVVCDLLNPLC